MRSKQKVTKDQRVRRRVATGIAKVVKHTYLAVDQYLRGRSPEVIEREVAEELDHKRREIIMLLLGFRHSPGGRHMEVDGYNNESNPAGDYLRTEAGHAVDKWLRQQAGNLRNIKISKRESAALLAKFRRILFEQLESRLHQEVAAVVEHHVDRMAKKMDAELARSIAGWRQMALAARKVRDEKEE